MEPLKEFFAVTSNASLYHVKACSNDFLLGETILIFYVN